MKIRTSVKAGGSWVNHSQTQAAPVVRTGVKVGGLIQNHSQTQAPVVRTGVKGGLGGGGFNHSQTIR
jgi:hypothetical protein